MQRIYSILFSPLDTFLKSIFSLGFLIVFSKYYTEIGKIRRNNKAKRCYVIGNGPSFKVDVKGKEDYLSSQNLFVVNHFAQSDLYTVLKPRYYVFADKAFWKTGLKEAPQKIVETTIQDIFEKTKWPMLIFVPIDAYKILKVRFNNNKNIRIIGYNKTSIEGYRFLKFWSYRKNLSMPTAQTVLNAAVFLGINLGFEEINLLGADHTWHRDYILRKDNVLCYVQEHFYNKEEPKLIEVPVNFLNEKTPKVHDQFYSLALAFESHHKLNEYAKTCKTQIYNRSSITFIDAYERKSF